MKGTAAGPVLCGVDFLPRSVEAAEVAAGIASKLKRPLIVAHALDFPELGSGEMIAAEVKRERKQQARKLARSLTRWGAASMSRPAISRWFLGSVAERTAQRSAAPTLVVREAAPFKQWLRGDRALKVLVSWSFSADGCAAARWARDLAAIGKCEFVIAHVDWPFEEHARIGGVTPPITGANPPEVQRVLERDLKHRAGQVFQDVPLRIRVEPAWRRTGARMAELAREEEADLLVVGSHQYRGFERLWHTSVSRDVLHEAQCSVAVVPAAAATADEHMAPEPIRRVLACTDFSELGNRAVHQAYSILGGAGTVHLLHVRPEPGRPFTIVESDQVNRSSGRELASLMKKLESLVPSDAAGRGIFSHAIVAENESAANGICQAAEQLGVDAICLASHGRAGTSRALLGSVAEEVMRCTRKLVVIVKHEGDGK